MAETACLRRSFSQPSEISHDYQEGDPLRALGESISFGRYMSESLAWEKWSTFSHNRYLEEAERYSKPGSVAKMKAYFEAHYNRVGAKKQSAQKQASDEPSIVEPEVQYTTGNSPSKNKESTIANSHTTIYEFPENEAPNTELLSSVDVSSSGSSTPIKELQGEEVDTVESGLNVVTAENSFEGQVHQSKDAEVNVSVTESSAEVKENSFEVQVHQSKNAEVNVSVSESSTEIKVNQSKDAAQSDIIVGTPERHSPVKEAQKEKLETRNKQKSANSSLKRLTKSNVSKLSSSLARLAIPVRPKMEGSDTPNNRKSAKEPLQKKNPTSKLVHMSINSDVNKIKPASPVSTKTGIRKVFTPLGKIIRDRFAPSPAPSRVSTKSASRHPSATPQSETTRSRIALDKSFASRTLGQKFQSPSGGKTNSLVQSPTTFASFSFRTEERAVKRREFLQKRLEKEAENLQLLDKSKVKLKTDTRKSSQCVNLKVNATLDIRTEVLSDNTTKSATARTHLPKCRSKPTSELARSTCFRPPQGSIGSKLGAEKSKSIPTQSRTLPARKKSYENASPNII